MVPVLCDASSATEILLLHAPYPGVLKFEGMPSSLLHAVAVFAHRLAREGRLSLLGVCDPVAPSPDYYAQLEEILRSPRLRVLCISATNASIEEALRAVELARSVRGHDLLVVVGGPHEDDCDEKVAARVPQVDLSIGGEAEYVLDFVLARFLERDEHPTEFLRWLFHALPTQSLLGGRVTVTSPVLGSMELALPSLTARDLPVPVWTSRRVHFSVFDAPQTLPVLVSRGCSYGKCTFCAEGNREGARLVHQNFDWLAGLIAMHPGAAVYFQDSIFPKSEAVDRQLLPMLRSAGVEWGAQVYLRALTRPWLEQLRRHGCNYLYTGLESGSADILGSIGKVNMNREVALQRLRWMRDLGFRVGISLMFGAISLDGVLIETEATVAETLALVDEIRELGLQVTGFYPNVLTVLSGTELERSLRARGIRLDFYRMPRCPAFSGFEDGAVGHNYRTIPGMLVGGDPLAGLEHRIAPWSGNG